MSSEKQRTFDEFTRSGEARWVDHEILGEKPLSEFLGPSLDEISFTMRFDWQHGVNPKAEMDRFLVKCREGQAEYLVIGGIPLGVDKWTVRTFSQGWKVIDGAGRLLSGTLNVTLKEYFAWE